MGNTRMDLNMAFQEEAQKTGIQHKSGQFQ